MRTLLQHKGAQECVDFVDPIAAVRLCSADNAAWSEARDDVEVVASETGRLYLVWTR